jgi:hypothetical protein
MKIDFSGSQEITPSGPEDAAEFGVDRIPLRSLFESETR